MFHSRQDASYTMTWSESNSVTLYTREGLENTLAQRVTLGATQSSGFLSKVHSCNASPKSSLLIYSSNFAFVSPLKNIFSLNLVPVNVTLI
jgi:hypothetical protein